MPKSCVKLERSGPRAALVTWPHRSPDFCHPTRHHVDRSRQRKPLPWNILSKFCCSDSHDFNYSNCFPSTGLGNKTRGFQRHGDAAVTPRKGLDNSHQILDREWIRFEYIIRTVHTAAYVACGFTRGFENWFERFHRRKYALTVISTMYANFSNCLLWYSEVMFILFYFITVSI